MTKRPEWLQEIIKEVRKWATLGILGISVTGVSGAWDNLQAFWRLPDAVAENTANIRKLLGEDRVIRQPLGLSYVVEPVNQGEDVEILLRLERTQAGADCIFTGGGSVFEDSTAIPVSGGRFDPQRQIGTDVTTLRVFVAQPVRPLRPGRVSVYLALEYMCGDASVIEKTDPMVFQLLN